MENNMDVTTPWQTSQLKRISTDGAITQIFARTSGVIQRIYPFSSATTSELTIRYSKRLPLPLNLNGLIWLLSHSPDGDPIFMAVDPEYIFERTGCFLNTKIAHADTQGFIPAFKIIMAAVIELATVLGISIERLLAEEECPKSSPDEYLALNYKKDNKVVMFGASHLLLQLEEQVRLYCPSYWTNHQTMGDAIKLAATVLVYPSRGWWSTKDLAVLKEGDLVTLQNFKSGSSEVKLRGKLLFANQTGRTRHLEVFLQMNEDDTRLQVGHEPLTNSPPAPNNPMEPIEEIELEIHAGKTTVLFSDLCSVQAGTLIELRDHHLPFVKLCVTGSPILEGELVNFQNQVMIQITKRLD